jgi:uncharacterized Ntn-hydrolase superfamily protein
MKKIFTLAAASILATFNILAQDTFSIVAVDTITGEIGSAGASCIGGSIIISDILPGRGAIHTQSYWNSTNQQNAHLRMEEGMSPQEIIDWLVENDVQNNPSIRQYGIVDVDPEGHPRSAAFTGNNCLDYKNHITGPNYAIQGNILLGQEILDSMESRFLNTEGSLPEKLMAALQGANVPGADSRCAVYGLSSLSAFIRVAWPDDTNGVFYLDLNVPNSPSGKEPIDSLQVLFDEWMGTVVSISEHIIDNDLIIYPNPAGEWLVVESRPSSVVSRQQETVQGNEESLTLIIMNSMGKEVERFSVLEMPFQSFQIDLQEYPPGMYTLSINGGNINTLRKFIVIK